jgi:malate synthase
MVIQMLSRGEDGARADCAMLDFEDSMKPEWPRVLAGFANLAGAARGDLAFEQGAEGGKPAKRYQLDPDDMPVVMVRCRGLHLVESNLRVDGEPVAAGLVDLAGATHHAAEALLARGRTPKFYVPKCEHHLEARWWGRLFRQLEGEMGLPVGTLRVTLLVETLPAAFQMEEILYELADRITALNVGRWDKIFSDIKTLGAHADRVLADRATIGLERPWMRAYAEQLIRVCHRHGAFAMGGMAAFTPGKSAERRQEQTAKVLADKRFEHALGHDGCWVSHPFFVAPALSAFPTDDQMAVVPALPAQPDLLPVGGGPRTLAGLAKNLRVGIAYLEGWQRGLGCVAWDDLMEDLATLEISRAQTWQWLHHGVELDDGPRVDRALVARLFAQEEARIAAELVELIRDPGELAAARARFQAARVEAERIFTESDLRPFLALASPEAGA